MDDFYNSFVNAGLLDSDPNESSFSGVDSSGNSLSTIPWGNILKFGGSTLGAYGNILEGNELAGANEYNAQLSLEVGDFKIQDIESTEEETLGRQHAMYAKSGVTMSGSPLDVALNTATSFEMDKQIVKYNAESRANMYNYQASVARSRGQIKAGQQLLSGGLSLGLSLL